MMPDIADSNALLGFVGPMAILAALGLNSMLLWSRRHSFADALLGRRFATGLHRPARPGVSPACGSNVVPFDRKPAFSRAAPVVRQPAARRAA